MGISELISIILSTLASVVVALGGLAVAYLHKKTKRLEAEKRTKDSQIQSKDTQIQSLHNGFKLEVYRRLGEVEEECSEIRTDTKLIKEFILKKKGKL